MNDDFDRWLEEFVTDDGPHSILPGHRVRLDALANPHILDAEQAAQLACRVLGIALQRVPEQPAVFADREASRNERHLLNLLAWRYREIDTLKAALVRDRDALSARLRLERAAPALLEACERMLADVERYKERGGTLTQREAGNVRFMEAAVALALPQEEEGERP